MVAKDKQNVASLTDGAGAAASRDRLLAVAEYVLARARRAGATGVAVGASIHQGLTVNVRLREVETVEYSRDRGVGITVYVGQRKGSASTGDLSRASIDASIDTACAIARHTEEDACAGLADADAMAEAPRELDLWHPWLLEPEAAIDLGLAIEGAALDHHELIRNSEGATVSTGHSVSVYANSHGFRGDRLSTRHSLSCSVLAEDGDAKQRDYHYDVKRSPDALDAAEAIGVEAARRAVARHGARSVPTCKVPVLFVPETARSLLGHLVAAVSGGNLYRGSTFLREAKGEQLFPSFVDVVERPFEAAGLRSTWFDNEGVATGERALVDAGVLQGYVLSSYSARKLGLETTGNAGGVHNLTLKPGQLDFDGLLQELGRGLVVTELMGQGVNLTTGDYSRGATGFWVEDGAIQFPVEGVTIAGNLREMFAGVAAVGSDIDLRAGIRTSGILLDQLTVAGE